MCNHYRTRRDLIPTWAEWIGYKPEVPADAAEDMWPKRQGVVFRQEEGRVISDLMSWGVPRTMPGKSGKPITKHVTNVRNLESPFWRSMIKDPARRCIVPFTEFFEPAPGKDPETGRPAEHLFRVPSAPVSGFAGIWRPSAVGNVFAFLTCEPNPMVAAVHPKAMPVILDPADYRGWLDGDYEAVCSLATAFPSQLMEIA
jgi:putative SOS response-associated peptidase YedK